MAVEDLAGQPVPGFLHGEPGIDGAPVAVVGRVDQGQ